MLFAKYYFSKSFQPGEIVEEADLTNFLKNV